MILSRREALGLLGGSAAAGLLGAAGLHCGGARLRREPGVKPFEVLEVSGSHREIGRAVGEHFRERIKNVLGGLEEYGQVVGAAQGEYKARVEAFLDAATMRFSYLVEELEGMAEGADLPFDYLFAWNCRSEIQAGCKSCEAGCSTVGLVGDKGRMLLAHNEDGAEPYLGQMFVLRATPPSGVSFAYLVYPGTMPGNGPGLNARGVVQTTNYISPREVPQGIPRYFVGRAICEARDLGHAAALAAVEGRAFPWHHNLASLTEGRLVSLETWPGKHHRREVTALSGVHLHTNHLLHEEMQGLDEKADYLDRSSRPRLEALQRRAAELEPSQRGDLLALLADRSGGPCKVCRVPGDEVPGVTLAAALFEAPKLAMTLLEANPCFGDPQTVIP